MKFSFILKKSLSAKAFGLKIFSRDDSQGIKTDGKHGGFEDRTRP